MSETDAEARANKLARDKRIEKTIRRLEVAIHRLNAFYLGGGTELLKEARDHAGEGVRMIGDMMNERDL